MESTINNSFLNNSGVVSKMHSQVNKIDSGGSSVSTGNAGTITSCSDFGLLLWFYQ